MKKLLILIMCLFLVGCSTKENNQEIEDKPVINNTDSPMVTDKEEEIIPEAEIPPVITFNDTITINAYSRYDLLRGVTAVDSEGSPLTVEIVGDWNSHRPGTYPLLYRATDNKGLTTEVSFNLIVKERVVIYTETVQEEEPVSNNPDPVVPPIPPVPVKSHPENIRLEYLRFMTFWTDDKSVCEVELAKLDSSRYYLHCMKSAMTYTDTGEKVSVVSLTVVRNICPTESESTECTSTPIALYQAIETFEGDTTGNVCAVRLEELKQDYNNGIEIPIPELPIIEGLGDFWQGINYWPQPIQSFDSYAECYPIYRGNSQEDNVLIGHFIR